MSWFLPTKKSKGRKGGGRKAAKASGPRWTPERTLLLLRATGRVVVIGLLSAGWVYGERWLEGQVGQSRAAEPRIELVNRPAWMSAAVADELRAAAAGEVRPDPFDRESLGAAARRLQQSPWVRRVGRIARRSEGVVEVWARYREPVALVEGRDGYHLVDRGAVRLPSVYASDLVPKLGLAVIRNVRSAPPIAGEVWSGADLEAGLRLASLIAAQPWAAQVIAVDVANYGGRADRARPHLKLVTRDGVVRWGRPPGDERFYEPTAERKIEHLNRVASRFGTIDAGGQVVDVHGDDAMKSSP